MKYKFEIPIKLPSLNNYVEECRYNKYMGAKTKRNVQRDIKIFIKQQLSNVHILKPVKIHFHWTEKDKRRDLDNVYSAQKFLLDSMVELELIKDDGQKYVTDLIHTHETGEEYKVIVELEEI